MTLWLALLLVLFASTAQAQPATQAGVDAFMHGDYQRAAEILKPLAEQADHIAEFFVAAMYDSGQGLPPDAMRACAFYMRASGDRGPFGVQATALVSARRGFMDRDTFEECSWRAQVGFDHRFDNVTFALGSGHWIAWDLRGATITYQGQAKRVPLMLAENGAVIVPLRYTDLAVGPMRSEHRHFIEILKWLPGRDRQTWMLMWSLREVVRDTLITVAFQQLASVAGAAPPTGRAFDGREMLHLGVSVDGDAEFTIVTEGKSRTTLIETEADRDDERDQRERQRARGVADERVDWHRVSDVHRRPALAYVDADTCGREIVYGWSADRMEAISLRAEKSLLGVGPTERTFDLGDPSSGLELTVHVADRPQRSSSFCSDVVDFARVEIWRAFSGSVIIQSVPRTTARRVGTAERVTVRIAQAEFVNSSGARVTLAGPIVLEAIGRSRLQP